MEERIKKGTADKPLPNLIKKEQPIFRTATERMPLDLFLPSAEKRIKTNKKNKSNIYKVSI